MQDKRQNQTETYSHEGATHTLTERALSTRFIYLFISNMKARRPLTICRAYIIEA